jgi:DNA (cytosine-5)-methyltransferase 1
MRIILDALKRNGYEVDANVYDAADYGTPTSRKRLFLIARCDGLPIVWPEPTHGKGRAQPWRTAAECIDFTLPCPSIFERKRPLAENTLRRIAKGVRKYVITAVDHHSLVTVSHTGQHQDQVSAFLMKYYGTDQDPQMSLPLHTITTKDRFGLVMVHGQRHTIADIGMRMLAPRELFRAQGFPETYRIEADTDGKPFTKSQQVRMCGNSVCPPLAEAIVRAQFDIMATEIAA